MLLVDSATSAGAVTAERRLSDGWSAGLVDLAIGDGDVVVTLDGGDLVLEDLELAIGPIDVPESVLGYGVQLTDITITLAEPTRIVTRWTGDDDAQGDVELELALQWSLTNHGTTSPLGAPDLPKVPATLALSGNGERVHAELRVHAPGELWSWADLLRLADLTLVLAAN